MPIREERRMHFVYARYHLTGLFAQRAPDSILPTLQKMQDTRFDEDRYVWTIGDIGIADIDIVKSVDMIGLIHGRLGKTAREVVETVYDDKIHSFKRVHVQSRKAAYSNFFIDPSHAILALEDKPLLPRGKFLTMFKQFWENAEACDIDFDFIKNEVEIFEVIKRWDKVTEAKFDLSPTNPHPRDDYSPLDDIIKQAQARRVRMKFDGQSNGLAKDHSIVQQGTSMAAAGYGEFSLKGVEKGSTQILSSNSLLVTHEVIRIDDLHSLSPEMLAEIRKLVKAMHDGKTQI